MWASDARSDSAVRRELWVTTSSLRSSPSKRTSWMPASFFNSAMTEPRHASQAMSGRRQRNSAAGPSGTLRFKCVEATTDAAMSRIMRICLNMGIEMGCLVSETKDSSRGRGLRVYEHHHGITAVREFPAAPTTLARPQPQTGLGRYERLRNFPRKVLCSSDCTGLLPMRNDAQMESVLLIRRTQSNDR